MKRHGEKKKQNLWSYWSLPWMGYWLVLGFQDSSVGKESTCNAGDPGSIPRSGRSPGEGRGYLLQFSCLENSLDCIVHGGHKESNMTEWLSLITFMRQIQGGITLNWRILMYQCFLFQIGQKQVMWKPQPSSSLLSHKSNSHLGASDMGCVYSYWNVKARHSTDSKFSSFSPPHQGFLILLPKGWAGVCFLAHGIMKGLPWWLSGKESVCNAGDAEDASSTPGLGRSPRGGNGNPLLYSCLENPTDRGAWRATVHGFIKKADMTEWLNNN